MQKDLQTLSPKLGEGVFHINQRLKYLFLLNAKENYLGGSKIETK